MEFENGFPPDDPYAAEYVDHGDLSPAEFESDWLLDGGTELTPDQLYELQCAQEDMRREEMLAAWGVETWDELEALGHDW